MKTFVQILCMLAVLPLQSVHADEAKGTLDELKAKGSEIAKSVKSTADEAIVSVDKGATSVFNDLNANAKAMKSAYGQYRQTDLAGDGAHNTLFKAWLRQVESHFLAMDIADKRVTPKANSDELLQVLNQARAELETLNWALTKATLLNDAGIGVAALGVTSGVVGSLVMRAGYEGFEQTVNAAEKITPDKVNVPVVGGVVNKTLSAANGGMKLVKRSLDKFGKLATKGNFWMGIATSSMGLIVYYLTEEDVANLQVEVQKMTAQFDSFIAQIEYVEQK